MIQKKFFAYGTLQRASFIFSWAVAFYIAFTSPSWSMQDIKDGSISPVQGRISPIQKYSPLKHRRHYPSRDYIVKLPADRIFSEPSHCEIKKRRRRVSDSSMPPIAKTFSIETGEKEKIFERLSLASGLNNSANSCRRRTKSQTSSQQIINNFNFMSIIREDTMEENRIPSCFSLRKPANLQFKMYVLLGYPGAGKGTFAEILKKKGYKHFSTGDILRQEVKNGTPFGLQYQQHIESSSQLLPSEIIESFLLKKIRLLIENKGAFILDGYPKTIQQAEYLNELIEGNGLQSNLHVIYLSVPLELALERIQTRVTCSDCGKIYNLVTVKPVIRGKCDFCDGSLFQRTCDTIEKFYERITLFNNTVKNVINYYELKNSIKKIESSVSLSHFIEEVLKYDEKS